jgi:hypothetical protein
METPILVACISAAVAVSSAAFALWGQLKLKRLSSEIDALQERQREQRDAAKAARRYYEPLLRSAYDLQSRLYNILMTDFVGRYLRGGSGRRQQYALCNTVFLMAQYFAWTEIIRTAIQFVDLGDNEQTRRLARLQSRIFELFTTHEFEPLFQVFAGEQRALGERMIRQGESGPECIGYGAFLEQSNGEGGFHPIATYIMGDLEALEDQPLVAKRRLTEVQNALIDLLDFLDPQFVRFDEATRSKVQAV